MQAENVICMFQIVTEINMHIRKSWGAETITKKQNAMAASKDNFVSEDINIPAHKARAIINYLDQQGMKYKGVITCNQI